MRAELPVLSFGCTTILAIILSLNLRRINAPNLTIIGWLLACNFLHGVNSIVWAGNVVIQISGWCDIGEPIATFSLELLWHSSQLRKYCLVQTLRSRLRVSAYFATLKRFLRRVKLQMILFRDATKRYSGPHCVYSCRSSTSVHVSVSLVIKYHLLTYCLRFFRTKSPIWNRSRLWLPSGNLSFNPRNNFNMATATASLQHCIYVFW